MKKIDWVKDKLANYLQEHEIPYANRMMANEGFPGYCPWIFDLKSNPNCTNDDMTCKKCWEEDIDETPINAHAKAEAVDRQQES